MTERRAKEELDFEIEFFEKVLSINPQNVEALRALGTAYTARGSYEEGLSVDLRLVRLRPQDPLVHYNLACSYSLLEQTEQAIASLRRALDLGYEDIEYMRRDPDLANVREDPRFRQLLVGRTHRALRPPEAGTTHQQASS